VRQNTIAPDRRGPAAQRYASLLFVTTCGPRNGVAAATGLERPYTTQVAQKHWSYIGSTSITQWSYIGPTFWSDNEPILAASRWFTDGQW